MKLRVRICWRPSLASSKELRFFVVSRNVNKGTLFAWKLFRSCVSCTGCCLDGHLLRTVSAGACSCCVLEEFGVQAPSWRNHTARWGSLDLSCWFHMHVFIDIFQTCQ